MTEAWSDGFTVWMPLEGAVGGFNCVTLRDDDDGLEIVLRPHSNHREVLRLLFESVVAYRNINESYRLRTWSRAKLPLGSSLLRTTCSGWIQWLREESGGVLDDVALTHYAIFTDEDCIDVATEFAPTASWGSAGTGG